MVQNWQGDYTGDWKEQWAIRNVVRKVKRRRWKDVKMHTWWNYKVGMSIRNFLLELHQVGHGSSRGRRKHAFPTRSIAFLRCFPPAKHRQKHKKNKTSFTCEQPQPTSVDWLPLTCSSTKTDGRVATRETALQPTPCMHENQCTLRLSFQSIILECTASHNTTNLTIFSSLSPPCHLARCIISHSSSSSSH